ncbi:MAG: hypothetical protein AAFQ87_12635 [Bacteroidota bacterium]
MQKFIFIFLWLSFATSTVWGQSIQLQLGRSNQDNFFVKAGYMHSFGERFSVGLEGQYGQHRYRFIGAKAIPEGNVSWVGVPIRYQAFVNDAIRLDLYLRSRLRFTSSTTDAVVLRSTALEFDPALIISLPINSQWEVQSGLILKTILEVEPNVLLEQQVSSLLLLGLNYAPSDRLALSLQGQAGPTSGAGGDTMKFYSFLQLGLAYSFGERSALSQFMLY